MNKIKVLIILNDAALHRSPEQQLTLHSPAPLHTSTFSVAEHASSVKQPFAYSSTDTPPFLMSTLILAQRLAVEGQVSSFLMSSQSPQLLVLAQE